MDLLGNSEEKEEIKRKTEKIGNIKVLRKSFLLIFQRERKKEQVLEIKLRFGRKKI